MPLENQVSACLGGEEVSQRCCARPQGRRCFSGQREGGRDVDRSYECSPCSGACHPLRHADAGYTAGALPSTSPGCLIDSVSGVARSGIPHVRAGRGNVSGNTGIKGASCLFRSRDDSHLSVSLRILCISS